MSASVLTQAWAVFRKELLETLRDRKTLAVMLLLPLALLVDRPWTLRPTPEALGAVLTENIEAWNAYHEGKLLEERSNEEESERATVAAFERAFCQAAMP